MTERSRIPASIKAIVRELFPRLEFLGFYKYRVVGGDSSAVSLQPVTAALKLPQLPPVPFRGAPGIAGELVPGAIVLVGFADGNPSEPFVGFVEGEQGAGFVPVSMRIDAENEIAMGGGHARVLRDGDSINVTGLVVGSTPVTAVPAGATISLGPAAVSPGPPPLGFSKVKA